jgi:hypothetical protein
MLERHLESADGRNKAAQIVIPRTKMKCWQRYTEDFPENTSEKIRPSAKSDCGITGYARERRLKKV